MGEQAYDVYRAAVYSMLRKNGNTLTIPNDELPSRPFTVFYRRAPNGDLQFKLSTGETKQ